MLAIAIVSVSAWVETISTIKLDLNNGTIDNYVFINANIGYGNSYDGNTIDLTKYFIPISSHNRVTYIASFCASIPLIW